ncbi:MAG: tRNA1(Val) (adenine(37)-N6)-methyltransferase [Prevotella sp.]
MKNRFNFKQFSICQDQCGMKVGTDGVLLGAWADGGRRILDIGTGTGIIALMMGQRFPDAAIDAIEIDHDACLQAADNIAATPFADRIRVHECLIQHFQPGILYDAIVSNPPYFINSLKNPNKKRATARHTDTLSPRDLFIAAERLLDENGIFSIIIPTDCAEQFISESFFLGFYNCKRFDIKTTESKVPSRVLAAFTKNRHATYQRTEATLMQANGDKTEWYRHLTEDFYL